VKVAIVGTGTGADQAPWFDPSWSCWGLNDGYELMPHDAQPALWFELHGDTPITRPRRRERHWQALADLDIPVYTFHTLPSVPKAAEFPLSQMLAAGYRDYFACTMAYQVAFALFRNATEIALYGMPLIYGREVVVEAKCVEWWLGFAQGRGVSVSVHHPYQFGLGKQAHRYAFDDHAERFDAYEQCLAVQATLHEWLPREAARLGVDQSI